MADDADNLASLPVSAVTALKPEAHEAFMAAFDATEPTDALVELMRLREKVLASIDATIRCGA